MTDGDGEPALDDDETGEQKKTFSSSNLNLNLAFFARALSLSPHEWRIVGIDGRRWREKDGPTRERDAICGSFYPPLSAFLAVPDSRDPRSDDEEGWL